MSKSEDYLQDTVTYKDTFSNGDSQMIPLVKGVLKKMNQPHISYVIVRP
jgi:hypothetical protein